MGRVPERFAVMAVDPGGVSGVAQGLFNAKRAGGSTRTLVRRAIERDAIRVDQIYGGADYATVGYDTGHVHRLLGAWRSFVFHANVGMGVAVPDIFLVFESFALRQRSVDLAPVQVTAGFECVMVNEPALCASGLSAANLPAIRYQPASNAMTYATNERLKSWGVYPLTRGKEHGRDATRHLLLRASKILDGEG